MQRQFVHRLDAVSKCCKGLLCIKVLISVEFKV